MKRKVSSNMLFIILTLYLTMAIVLSLFGDRVQAAEKEPIKLGVLTDLTGPASNMVVSMDAWGFPDCIEDINSRGGINGHKIEVTILDTAYKMDNIFTAYEQLVSKKVLAIQSSLSPAIISLKKRIVKDKIVMFLGNSPTEGIWPAGYVYNKVVSWADVSGLFVDRVIEDLKAQKRDLKKNPPKIAWVYADNAFGRSCLPALPYAEARGCINVISAGVPMVPTDTSSTLRSIKDSGADVVFLGHMPAPNAVILKDAKRVGLNVPYYTWNGGPPDSTIVFAGALAEGLHCETAWETFYPPEILEKYPAVKKAMKYLKTKHPDWVKQANQYFPGWINGVILEVALEKAIEKKGWPINGEDLKNALDDIKNLDMGGLQPNISYYRGVDNRGASSTKWRKIVKKQKGPTSELVVESEPNYVQAPVILPAGFEAQTPGLKELCKERGLTYFSPESGLIIGK